MSPDTVCQKCKATFSATKRAALRDWEQEHYDKSHTSLLVGGDGRQHWLVLTSVGDLTSLTMMAGMWHTDSMCMEY